MRTGRLVLVSIMAAIATTAVADQKKPVASTPPAAKPAAPPMMDHSAMHVMMAPAEMQWVDAPPSLPRGAKFVVVEGDPSKPGPFTMRLKVPAKYTISPHWHPAIEHVTVLEGEVFMGAGEKFDLAVAKKLPTGGFAVMPTKFPHFFFSKKKAVIQVHGIGPWGINYINPADDPRNAPPATK